MGVIAERLVVGRRQVPQPHCSVGRSTREHVTPVVKKKKTLSLDASSGLLATRRRLGRR